MEAEKPTSFAAMLGDRIYDSDNEFDIPTLRLDRQPTSGLLLPFSGWGSGHKSKERHIHLSFLRRGLPLHKHLEQSRIGIG